MHRHEIQQIIIYLNKQFSRVLFPYENQSVTQSHDLKLGTKISLETEAELNKNSHNLELPPH
jgi:hypothetical protein